MPPLNMLSATELAHAIRSGRCSPIDVVETYIARINAVNPALNAVVTPTFEQARREAHAAAQHAPQGPLHGVPVTIKDSFDVAGVRSTCGLTAHSQRIPEHDATVVARLRAAGAIVLGKTNTPDNCWSQETDNLLFGRTNNPWDLQRSVGGSTGGEAAIIAAGGSPLGIGSDIAGSIRLPAAFTGIAGLRPTSGKIDETGFWPPSAGLFGEMNAIGPMARRVEDLALGYSVLSAQPLRPLDPTQLRGKALAFWLDDGLVPSSSAIKGGVRAAVAALEKLGMQARATAPAARRLAMLGWGCIPPRAFDDLMRSFNSEGGLTLGRELLNHGRGNPTVSCTALYYWLNSWLSSRMGALSGIDRQRWRTQLREQFAAAVGNDGVAICPIFPTTAPHHNWSYAGLIPLISYQVWVNFAGLPALSLPVGRSRNGMPVNVQIVGMPDHEWTLLNAGYALQQALMPIWNAPNL